MAQQQQVSFEKGGEPLKQLSGKQVLFPVSVYESAKRSKLLFTSNLDQSMELGTGEIQYVKPRGDDQPFLIVKFELLQDSLGVMLGDLKETTKAETKAPDAMLPVKKSNKITSYKINPNAKFGWDQDNRTFIVKA